MIICRTPFRVSLLGGGTDFPEVTKRWGGLVVGGAINRFSYLHVRKLPPFHEYKTRLVYRQIETVASTEAIEHAAAKACIKVCGLHDQGLEILHAADLPGRSGTGSSSSFVVGLLLALHALQGKYLPPDELASLAIEIEQKHLGETVGCQDQTFAAYGGLNTIQFRQNGDIVTSPLSLSVEAVHLLESHLMLFFTGIPRTSSEVAATYVPQLHEKERQHHTMLRLAEQGIDAIYRGNLERLGWLIDQSWRIKAGLSSAVTNASINETYATARLLGAFGGKLTGAGGGGSLLLVVAPEKQKRIADAMSKRGCVQVPFRFTQNGSSVIFYDRDSNAN